MGQSTNYVNTYRLEAAFDVLIFFFLVPGESKIPTVGKHRDYGSPKTSACGRVHGPTDQLTHILHLRSWRKNAALVGKKKKAKPAHFYILPSRSFFSLILIIPNSRK